MPAIWNVYCLLIVMVRVHVRHAGQRSPSVVRMAVVLLAVMASVVYAVL